MQSLTLQSISFLMLNSCLLCLFISIWQQTTICLQVPRRLSLHFVTFGVLRMVSCEVNFAHVRILFRFCGWRLLGISLVLFSSRFIFGLAFKIEIDSFMIGQNFGFFGLLVETKVNVIPSGGFSFGVRSCSCGISLAFLNPLSIKVSGYPRCLRVPFKSFNLVLRVVFSLIMVHSLLARL